MRILLLLSILPALLADGPGVIFSRRIQQDFALTADPHSGAWKGVPGIFAENGPKGEPVPGHRTEIRSRWSAKNLYVLFVCPYQQLYLKPDPSTTAETNRLWNWDVAEIFAGADFQNITRYREFQVSPQGEWVDLDIDRVTPQPEGGWRWNSGFEVKARIDSQEKIWYGEFRIPLASIDPRPPKPGNLLRINFYRIQGPPDAKRHIAWQPTGQNSYHVPEAFGRLRLE
ncbi:MAG: carbohydrate-binding family 9-like protein [Acidobacteria bacterium]|nr:carbohydrate-binding family 9-like protein [Acidobacteriota bacterium]